jgi:hypothetical protein
MISAAIAFVLTFSLLALFCRVGRYVGYERGFAHGVRLRPDSQRRIAQLVREIEQLKQSNHAQELEELRAENHELTSMVRAMKQRLLDMES